MTNKKNITGEMTCKKGATKHCCWGLCNSDSRYVDRLKEGVFLLRFAKPRPVKDNITSWQKEQEEQKTEKAKHCLHAYLSDLYFTSVKAIHL